MVRGSWLISCLLVFACSEYKMQSTEDAAGTLDEEPAEDTAPPVDEEEEPEDPAPPEDTANIETPEEDPPDTGEPCTEVVTAFDIEEVSTLQDAASPRLVSMMTGSMYTPWYRDALILDYVVPESGDAETWRISAMYILIMVPASRFDAFADGELISVEVYDGPDPRTAAGWTVTQAVNRAELTWADYTLPWDAAISGYFGELGQKGAWLRLEFAGVIPDTGMTSSSFVAGIQWEELSPVAVGYSNFNRACDRTWTEWSPGSGWHLNGDDTTSDHCSCPMMRVEIERTYSEDCR